MPDPVGAQIRALAPEAIAGQPCAWAGVGASNDAWNQRRVRSLNAARGSVFALPEATALNLPILRPSPNGRTRRWAATKVIGDGGDRLGVAGPTAVDAYNRGDFEGALAYASERVELKRIETSPDGRDVVRGRDAVIEFFRPDVFVDQRSELVELIRAGEDAIVTQIRFTARGSGSGVQVPALDSFIVWRIEGDEITRIEFYNESEAAWRSVGVDPPS